MYMPTVVVFFVHTDLRYKISVFLPLSVANYTPFVCKSYLKNAFAHLLLTLSLSVTIPSAPTHIESICIHVHVHVYTCTCTS